MRSECAIRFFFTGTVATSSDASAARFDVTSLSSRCRLVGTSAVEREHKRLRAGGHPYERMYERADGRADGSLEIFENFALNGQKYKN